MLNSSYICSQFFKNCSICSFFPAVLMRYIWLHICYIKLVAKSHTLYVRVFFLSTQRVFILLGWACPLNYYLLHIFLANILFAWIKINFRLLSMINHKIIAKYGLKRYYKNASLYRSYYVAQSLPTLNPNVLVWLSPLCFTNFISGTLSCTTKAELATLVCWFHSTMWTVLS